MTRMQFERLISAWLDRPTYAPLQTRLDDALRTSPNLESLKDEWQRLNALVRSCIGPPVSIVWARLSRRIGAVLDADDDLRRANAVRPSRRAPAPAAPSGGHGADAA